jgi:copper oxidase (laccase) domain-containing protein
VIEPGDILTSPLLADQPGLRHGFFTRRGGVSGGVYAGLNVGLGSRDDPAAVRENRARAAAAFGQPPASLTTCYQVHSAVAVTADAPWGDTRREGDAVVTARAGVMCGALSADCAPVLLFGGIVAATVARMGELGADPARIVAVVGPCIGPDSYEVGADFREAFAAQAPEASSFFRPAEATGKQMFDLPGFVLDRLGRAGVVRAEWIGRDTYAEDGAFFSNRRAVHRGEGDYGRLLSAIMLEP